MAIDNREQARRWLKNYQHARSLGLTGFASSDLLDFARSIMERYVDEDKPKKKKDKRK